MTAAYININGLQVGALVEVCNLENAQLEAFEMDINNALGQIVNYVNGEFYVYLACGVAGYFQPKNLRPARSCKELKDGVDKAGGFDMLIGPATDPMALGEEISTCLLERGYCVLKICQNANLLESALEKLREMAEDGKLNRLPEEVEEGYLGNGCMGKVAWLDPENSELCQINALSSNDGNLSYIAQVFQPFSEDTLGQFVDERTPALVCLSLSEAEEPEYPPPEADDGLLGTFLGTWRRGVVRVVHFMGPSTASMTLEARDLSKEITVEREMAPNTILLFRPDVYEYSIEAPSDTLMLIANLLSPAPVMRLSEVEGQPEWITDSIDGPPPPPGLNQLYIINSVARLPGNWDNQWSYFSGLKAATDTVIEIPLTRWDVHLYWTPDENEFQSWQTTCRHQSYCEGAELFDNKHFEISNAEAGGMDPVQRLICECGAQSLAMMGLTKKVANRKSSHAGFAVGNDKLDWMTCEKTAVIGGALGGTSTVLAIIANRFSFLFNLKGPNFVCDTACSASLTSTHCVKMMMKERTYDPLEWFLSMGAHLCLSGGPFIGCSQSHMSSPTGRCLTFNASANGYLRGEGICGFMLKFGDFKHDSMNVILRATQVGQDGRSASLTAPNGPAQEEMVTRAIKEAQMIPPESTVWECHGTGTSLGDPIEVGAVRKVQIRIPRKEPLMLTSNKSNIGHLEGGAAMGAMCKCVLQCKYTRCCPTLHLRTLNPHLEHAAFDAIFQTEAASYTYSQGHSQVSSFGFGGTNAHGIFWGRNLDAVPPLDEAFKLKLAARPPPEVRPIGSNYDEWQADFPDIRGLKLGAKFTVRVGENDQDQPLKYEFVEDGPDLDAEDEDVFFSIAGNFNDWQDERMEAGDIPGVHCYTAEVPDTGVVEFHFIRNGDKSEVLCPAVPVCYRMTEAMLGPGPGLTNKWQVISEPGEVRIELFVKQGRKSLVWFLPS